MATESGGDDRRALVDLLPQFLSAAMRGWSDFRPLLQSAGIMPPVYFLLRAFVGECDRGTTMTEAEMFASFGNPYKTYLPQPLPLGELVAGGFATRGTANRMPSPMRATCSVTGLNGRDGHTSKPSHCPTKPPCRTRAHLSCISARGCGGRRNHEPKHIRRGYGGCAICSMRQRGRRHCSTPRICSGAGGTMHTWRRGGRRGSTTRPSICFRVCGRVRYGQCRNS